MMEKDKDITGYTTFGIPVKAAWFAEYTSEKELLRLSRTQEFIENEVLHIGGGSNLLFTEDFNGLVLHSRIMGMRRYDKDSETVYAIVGAGEKWTDFVEWCLDEGLAGVENLSGIPGEVGASPVQNVGAYGVEAKDVIQNVEVFDAMTRQTKTFTNEECRFGYRDSRFKHEWKGRYYVLRVSFRLRPSLEAKNIEYGTLKHLADKLGHTPDIREVAREVVALRDSKLPNPGIMGSAGSFFKNPVVSRFFLQDEMLRTNPDIPYYEISGNPGMVKVPAGWLIEHSGLKGKTVGGAKVYEKQCLVIVNTGDATSTDVVTLSEEVKDTVRREMGITLQPEVNFIDTSMKITVLGSGTSKGVPEVACGCRVCRSEDKRDKRLRASVLVQTHGLDLLIDVSPDFRSQALEHGINHLDALLITHSHYDHVGGFDDLRPFCGTGKFPVYLRPDVNRDLHNRLDYCFRKNPYPGVPTFDMHELDNSPVYIDGVKITPISVMHGSLPIVGYRIGDFAYITDAKTIPEEELKKLEDLEVLIVNALRPKLHFAHFNFEEAVELVRRVRPKEAYLTHFNHEVGFHNDLETRFGEHIHPAYDGLTLEIK